MKTESTRTIFVTVAILLSIFFSHSALAGYSFADDYFIRLQAEKAGLIQTPQVYRPGMELLYTETVIARRARIVKILHVDENQIHYSEKYVASRLGKCEGKIERSTGREVEFQCNGQQGPTTDRQPMTFTSGGSKTVQTERGPTQAIELRFAGTMGAFGKSDDTVYISDLAPGPGVLYHVSRDISGQVQSEWLD